MVGRLRDPARDGCGSSPAAAASRSSVAASRLASSIVSGSRVVVPSGATVLRTRSMRAAPSKTYTATGCEK